MAIKDNKSNTLIWANGRLTTAASTSVDAESVDTADYDNGVTFFLTIFGAADPADTVSFTKFQDSDDNVTFADVDSGQYIGELANMQTLNDANFTQGQAIPSLGVFGTRRYVRAVIETGANSGPMTLNLNYNLGPEIKPGAK